GMLVGEWPHDTRSGAERLIARMEGGQLADTPAAKAAAESERAVRQAANANFVPGKAVVMQRPAQTMPPTGRLGFADLKRAALERRAGPGGQPGRSRRTTSDPLRRPPSPG